MKSRSAIIWKILTSLALVVLVASLVSPPIYWLGTWLAEAGVLPFLQGFPFHRYFSRCLQVCLLLALYPTIRWIGPLRLCDFGVEKSTLRTRDALAGCGIGLVPLVAIGAIFIAWEVYRIRNNIPPFGWARIMGTAAAVGVLEELLFRGILLGSLMRVCGTWPAAVGSSAIFAIVHFMRVARPPEPPPVTWTSGFEQIPQTFSSAPEWPLLGWGMLSLFVAGMLLCWCAVRTRSLFLPIGLHAGWIMGQQGINWIGRYRVSPPEALLPWVGPNVVSGAVPTGLVPMGLFLLTGIALFLYMRYARTVAPTS